MIRLDLLNNIRKKYDTEDKYTWIIDTNDGELVLEVTYVSAWGRVTVCMPACDLLAIRRKIAQRMLNLEKMAKVLDEQADN